MDLTKLTAAPWEYLWKVATVYGPGHDHGGIPCSEPLLGSKGCCGESDLEFAALARNAFDGDPEALAWWEANRKRRISEPEQEGGAS